MSRYSPTVLPTTVDPYEPVDRLAQALAFAQQEGERKHDRRRQLQREELMDHNAGIRRGDVPTYGGPMREDIGQAFKPGAITGGGAGATGVAGAAAIAGARAIADADTTGRARHESRFIDLGRGAYLDREQTPEAIARATADRQQRGIYAALQTADPEGAERLPFVQGYDYGPELANALNFGRDVRLEDRRSTLRRGDATHESGLRVNEMGVEYGHRGKLQDDEQRFEGEQRSRDRALKRWEHTTVDGNTAYTQSQLNFRHANEPPSAEGRSRGPGGLTRKEAFQEARGMLEGRDVPATPEEINELADGLWLRPLPGTPGAPAPRLRPDENAPLTIRGMRVAPPAGRSAGGEAITAARWDQLAAEAHRRGLDPVEAIGFPRPRR